MTPLLTHHVTYHLYYQLPLNSLLSFHQNLHLLFQQNRHISNYYTNYLNHYQPLRCPYNTKKVLVVHVEYKQKNNVETDVANTSVVTDAYG